MNSWHTMVLLCHCDNLLVVGNASLKKIVMFVLSGSSQGERRRWADGWLSIQCPINKLFKNIKLYGTNLKRKKLLSSI